jgi:glucokinase
LSASSPGDATSAIGVDVGGTKLLAVRVESAGRVVADPLQSSPKSGAALVSDVVETALRLADGAVPSLGIGVPGRVDGDGTVRFAPHLQGVVGERLGDDLRRRLHGAQVWVGNDAVAACWAEHELGGGRGSTDMVMVTLGTGIGGGVVVGGQIVEGTGRFAGEIGHMVVDPGGPPCPCGKRGCWETFASGNGLGRLGRELALAGRIPAVVELAGGDPEAVRGEHVSTAALAGDLQANEVVATFAEWVTLGLANLVSILDPEVIVIGGGLVEVGELLLAPIRRSLRNQILAAGVRPPVRVVPAELGPQAGAIGAALLGVLAGRATG